MFGCLDRFVREKEKEAFMSKLSVEMKCGQQSDSDSVKENNAILTIRCHPKALKLACSRL